MGANGKPKTQNFVFLDRDGVINEFPGNGKYVTRCAGFRFIPGSLDGIKRLSDEGYRIFVVSNQAGVGKGLFSVRKLQQITDKMLRGVAKTAGKIDKVYYSIKRSDEGCPDRKPRIGSIEKAMKRMKRPLSDAKKGFFVGDTASDIQAGQNAGCKTILVLSGRENRGHVKKYGVKPDYIAKNLLEATEIIINENARRSRHSRRRS